LKIGRNKYDTIINKTPLSYKTNRVIGGDAPSVYLAGLAKKGGVSETSIDGHLRTHMIEPGLIRADDFDGFIKARRESLLSLIERAMGKGVYRGELSDEPEGEQVIDEADALEFA
jgi:hypothetical protein